MVLENPVETQKVLQVIRVPVERGSRAVARLYRALGLTVFGDGNPKQDLRPHRKLFFICHSALPQCQGCDAMVGYGYALLVAGECPFQRCWIPARRLPGKCRPVRPANTPRK